MEVVVEEPSRYIDRQPRRAWQRFRAAARDGGEEFAATKWLAKSKNGALLRLHDSSSLTLTCKSHLSDCLANISSSSSQLPKHHTQICQIIPVIVPRCWLFELSRNKPLSLERIIVRAIHDSFYPICSPFSLRALLLCVEVRSRHSRSLVTSP